MKSAACIVVKEDGITWSEAAQLEKSFEFGILGLLAGCKVAQSCPKIVRVKL